jgi:glycosyltransferase involved in cell wall biosynthesis
MVRRTRILFVRAKEASESSFINRDIELLKKHFDVRVIDYVLDKRRARESAGTIWRMCKGLVWADASLSWFAVWHARTAVRLSKIFLRKSIALVGGYEVASMPEIAYGAQLNPETKKVVDYVLKNATKVVAGSEFTKSEILRCTKSPEKVELVLFGVDSERFKPGGARENLVITVAIVNESNIVKKGLDKFVMAAKHLPEMKFALIGKCVDGAIDKLKPLSSPNVQFVGYVAEDELIGWYQRAKVYCQISYHEGFGIALAESMLCGCVPVVTNRTALPEVAGDTAVVLNDFEVGTIVDAISRAVSSGNGERARERVLANFTMDKREAGLVRLINDVVDGKR